MRVRAAPRSRVPYGDDGFTLVEMLVALTLASLVSAAALGLVTQLSKTRKIARSVELQTQASALENHLVALLERAIPVTFSSSERPQEQIVFDGRPHQISLVSQARTGFQGYGLANVTIRHDPATGRLIEELSRRRGSRTAELQDQMVSIVLATDVREFESRYLKQGTAGSEGSWLKEFPDSTACPVAIRITGVLDRAGLTSKFEAIAGMAVRQR